MLKRKGDRKAPLPIYIALYQEDETQLIYTGQRIKEADWNNTDRLPKKHDGEIFKEIEKVRRAVDKAKAKLEYEDKPITPFSVKQMFEMLYNEKSEEQLQVESKAKQDKKTIYSLASHFCNNLPDVKQSTKNTLRISIQQFMLYLEKSGQKKLEKSKINEEVIAGYGRYLLTKKHGGKSREPIDKVGLANTTYNKRIKHLHQFLKTIDVQLPVKLRKVRKRAIISLSVSELRKLEAINVTLHKNQLSHTYLQRAKDMFLLGCYTALRISDLKRLNPANTQGGFITLTTQKNNEVFRMPIVPQAKQILEKYNNRAPKISEQEVNRSIKDVCQLAGIDTPIEWDYSLGGKDLIKTVPKYELITSHIAGKTFITNARELWGLEPIEVAAIVRKDFKTMLKHYFNTPVESAIAKMMNSSAIMKKSA